MLGGVGVFNIRGGDQLSTIIQTLKCGRSEEALSHRPTCSELAASQKLTAVEPSPESGLRSTL